jgi:hypothetical protein
VLNNAAPVYYIHVLPALLVPLGPLFSHGVNVRDEATRRRLGPGALIAFAFVASALCAANGARLLRAAAHPAREDPTVQAFAERVRAITDKQCKLAGDAGLYVEHFADFPYFLSTRPTEVHYAMIFFGVDSEDKYWTIKRPDVVFGPGALSPALARYVSANGFSARAAGVWARREGCAGGP